MLRARQCVALAAIVIVGALSALLVGTPASAQTEIRSLSELVRLGGDDPRAGYARLRIPSLGVDAPVGAHDVADEVGTQMPDPYGPADVAWYDFEHPSFGGAPGGQRNVVVSGHIDYNARVSHAGLRYRGPGVFERLEELRPGDVIEVVRNGRVHRYAVSWTKVVAERSSSWASLLSSDTPIESLTLYTCDGAFDRGRLSYSHRLVVRAELLEGQPSRFRDADAFEGYSVFRSGTTHPAVLFRAQTSPISILFMWHEGQQRWLTYRPTAPASANTLLGHLRVDSVVVAGIPDARRR